MKYKEFYKEIREVIELVYEIDTEYQLRHKKIMTLIEKIDRSQNKKHDNFRYSYLPKTLPFSEAVAYAVVTTTKRFINENKYYQEQLKELPKGSYIGYWTTVKKAIFYTENRQSLGQYVVPKKGLIIFQNKPIKIIEKNDIRQRRSDSKYHDFIEVGEIEIDDEKLPKKVFRRKQDNNITN